jgi:hypothetical protein
MCGMQQQVNNTTQIKSTTTEEKKSTTYTVLYGTGTVQIISSTSK